MSRTSIPSGNEICYHIRSVLNGVVFIKRTEFSLTVQVSESDFDKAFIKDFMPVIPKASHVPLVVSILFCFNNYYRYQQN